MKASTALLAILLGLAATVMASPLPPENPEDGCVLVDYDSSGCDDPGFGAGDFGIDFEPCLVDDCNDYVCSLSFLGPAR